MAAQDQSFPPSARLKQRASYLRLGRTGQRLVAPQFVLLWRVEGSKRPRLGITVTKKVAGAVGRNRIKRLVREHFRKSQAGLPLGLELLVIARQGADRLSLSQLESQLLPFLRRIAIDSAGT